MMRNLHDSKIKSSNKLIGLFFLLALSSFSQLFGQTNTWDGSSSANWNTAANWSLNLVPTAAHDVVIPNNFNVTVNTSAVCKTITINPGANANTITISANQSLTVSGAVTIGAGSGNGDDKVIEVGSGTLTCLSITMTDTENNNRDSYISVGTGTVTVSDNITMNGTASRNQIVFTDIGTLNVGGSGTITGGTISNASGGYTALTRGTINYTGTNQSVGAYDYYNLILTGSGIKTIVTAANGTLTTGNLSIAPTGSAKASVTNTAIKVGSLTLGGLGTASGLASWGSTSSSATYQNDTYFAATTGTIGVTTDTRSTPVVTPTVGTYTYNGAPQGPNSATNTGTGTSYTFNYSGTGGTTYGPSATRPTNAGSYTVTATVDVSTDGFYKTASSSATAFTISKVHLTVTADAKSKSYDGSVFSPFTTTITGFVNSETSSVVTGAATYSGAAVAAIAAGSYTITPAVGNLAATNYDFTTFNNGTLTIGKATATVTLGNLAPTYNGSGIAATATTNPTGLTVDLTYNGSSTAPTAAGTYAVVGTINDSNYQGSASGSMVIGKAIATVSLGNLTPTYTGSAISATATTTPAGLTVDFTYDGSATAPTNAGTYAVVGTINDSNYQGSASGSMVIGKANSTITATGTNIFTYTGSAQGPTTSTVSGSTGGVAYSYSGTGSTSYTASATRPTNAGTYQVIATVAADVNYFGASSVAFDFTINKANAIIVVTFYNVTYDSNPHTSAGTATGVETPTPADLSSLLTLSGTTHTAAGTYNNDAWSFAGNTNYNSTTGTVNNAIGKANSTIAVTGSSTFTYTGSAQGPTTSTVTGSTGGVTYSYSGTGSTSYTASATRPTNAGTYQVIATVAADANYFGATSSPLAFTIGKATPVVTPTVGTYTYNGLSQGPSSATNSGTGSSYTFSYVGVSGTSYSASATPPTNAGSYNVTVTVAASADGNYDAASSSATAFTIDKLTLSITSNNQSKCFAQTINFAGTEFTSSGLISSDAVTSVTLTSAGTDESSTVSGSPYSIVPSSAVGTGLDNYIISYNNGTLTVNPLPTITLGTSPSVCKGTTMASLPYTATTSSPNQYSITYDGAAHTAGFSDVTLTSLPATPINLVVPSAPAAGTYNGTITVKNSATGCSSLGTAFTVTVNPTPSVITANTAVICSGESPNISLASSPATPASSFVWTIGIISGGITGASSGSGTIISQTLTNPIHTAAGTVQYIVTPTAGLCTGSAYTITVTVDPVPGIGGFN